MKFDACWIAATLPDCGPCSGQAQRAHLIPRRVMKGALGPLSVACPVARCAARPRERCRDLRTGQQLKKAHTDRVSVWNGIVWDSRGWRWMCEAHHHGLDYSRTIRIPREALPAEVEQFAVELGLSAWIEREYGAKERAA